LPICLSSSALIFPLKNDLCVLPLPFTSSVNLPPSSNPQSFPLATSLNSNASSPASSTLNLLYKRLAKGYGLDPELNAKILAEETGKRDRGIGGWIDFWEFLGKSLANCREGKKDKGKETAMGIMQLIKQSDVNFEFVFEILL
jgi:hypothetical protein